MSPGESDLHVTVDISACQAYANCLLAAPDVFDLDEETSVAVVLPGSIDESRRAAVEEAVESCPMQALTLKEG